jgi:hypothetical protein
VRRAVQLLSVTYVLFGSALVLAGPAAADEAQPYRYSDCFDNGSGYVLCQSSKGVLMFNESASGNLLFKASGDRWSQATFNGQVVYETSDSSNTVSLAKDSNTQAYHGTDEGYFNNGSTTCTYQNNYTYANGEYRHAVYNFQCTP